MRIQIIIRYLIDMRIETNNIKIPDNKKIPIEKEKENKKEKKKIPSCVDCKKILK